jgi:nucleoid-associated protein YgaU
MSENAFQQKTDAQLLAIGEQASAAIAAAGDPGYGVPAAQTTALTNANTAVGAAITAKQAARDASKAATQAALTARQAMLDALGSIGATIYNNPAVDNEMIAEAGYAVHDDVPTKHAPTQPLDLTATPDAYGTVTFNFHNNGNPYPTTYIIEGRPNENTDWTTVITTTRTRMKAEGFLPGVTYWFRVRASRNGATSIPSNVAAIWEPEQVVPLQMVA